MIPQLLKAILTFVLPRVIISVFDIDDTLVPTTDFEDRKTTGEPYSAEELAQLDEAAYNLLSKAITSSHKVYMITAASKEPALERLKQLTPRAAALIEAGTIELHSAYDHYRTNYAHLADYAAAQDQWGDDSYFWKTIMFKELVKFCRFHSDLNYLSAPPADGSGRLLNIVGVGDRPTDAQAFHDRLSPNELSSLSVVKTAKVMEYPSIGEITSEMLRLEGCFASLVSAESTLRWNMAEQELFPNGESQDSDEQGP
jgi:hypothetical protein